MANGILINIHRDCFLENPLAKQRLPRPTSNAPSSPQDKFQAQLQSLLKQHRQALEGSTKPRERSLTWCSRPQKLKFGYPRQARISKGDFKQTDTSLRRCDWV